MYGALPTLSSIPNFAAGRLALVRIRQARGSSRGPETCSD
jgi:hypothetical protein